jgi:MFS family permease
LRRVVGDPAAQAVLALGITQIVSWGTTFYALGVLGKPIAAATGWSQSIVFGGLTIGLLTSGAVSAYIGRLIDRRGAQIMMTSGSILAAVGLALLSAVTDPVLYLAVWVLIGVAMRLTLYDAAFAALVQVTPARGRRAISYLTLFGGFASSVFWPIGHALEEAVGWRATFLVFAAVNLLLCLPLHWFGLKRRQTDRDVLGPDGGEMRSAHFDPPLEGAPRTVAMVLFGLMAAASAVVLGAMAVHLVPLLEASGIALATAVALASLKGVAQVVGRVWEILFAANIRPLNLGRISIAPLPLSFVVLIVGGASVWTALAFTLLFGLAHGLMTIVRGAVPLVLFGPKAYGEVLGVLATPYLLLAALSPAAFAFVVEHYGYGAGEAVMLAAASLSFLAMEAMAFWYRRLRPQSGRRTAPRA